MIKLRYASEESALFIVWRVLLILPYYKVMLQILQNFHSEASQCETFERIRKPTFLHDNSRDSIKKSSLPIKDGFGAG